MSGDEMLAQMNGPMRVGTMLEALDIIFTRADRDHITATMPVGPQTRQPFGFLHGGASVALAESLASVGTFLNIDPVRQSAFGLEINANHLRSRREGLVIGEARPLHKGRTNMIWDIKIRDEEGKLICVSRCTVAIVDRPAHPSQAKSEAQPEPKE
jgi:1,4-dihydroxy-2-naphthoyl-CoA hydrolase